MTQRLFAHSRARMILLTCVFLLGLVPIGVATADSHRTSSRTEIEFTSTPAEILVPGVESVDEAGIYRFRGEVAREIVEGDINGELIVTFNGDFIPGPNCDPDDPDNCTEGEFSAWGTAVITDENGTWEGDFVIAEGVFEGESYAFGETVLIGRGGNAGKSIFAEISFSDDEEDETAYFTGFMLTMGVPAIGVNMHTQLCVNDEDGSSVGAFHSTGAIESSGGASGAFFSGGHWWTHTYGLLGRLEFTDDHGSMTIQFSGTSQDTWQSSVGWGHWIIVDGTGAYESAYGHGKITGSAGDFEQCASGWGVGLQLLGNIHMN